MQKKYFITGTDTNCGKTYVTCQLLQILNSQKYAVRALKPVASGCSLSGDKLINEDICNILQYDLTDATSADICNWQFLEAIAPHIAAHDANINIKALDIAKFCQNPKLDIFDYVLIEGAGGLMVPLNAEETWVDFLNILKIPVLLVIGMRLGCINHALLTVDNLKQHKIKLAGWFANCIDPQMLRIEDNIYTLQQKIQAPCLGIIKFEGGLNLNSIKEII